MSDRPTKKSKIVKSSPSLSLSPPPVNPAPEVIINGDRSDKVDFTIIVNEKSVKTRYGVEKNSLALHSTFFKHWFDEYSKRYNEVISKEEFEIKDEFPNNVVRLALGILSGIVDKEAWTIDESAGVVDFGHKYFSNFVVQHGLQRFCQAFASYAEASPYTILLPSTSSKHHSRFGCSVFIKFVSLWRRMLQDELFYSPEIPDMYFWCMERVWQLWSKNQPGTLAKITIESFINKDTHTNFTSQDICVATKYLEIVRKGSTKDLRVTLKTLYL